MVGAKSRDQVQALSKSALGRDHRLTLARAILARGDDLFDLATLEEATGVPDATVFREVAELHDLGVLNRVEDRNRVFYHRVDSPFWAWCQELLDRVTGADSSVR